MTSTYESLVRRPLDDVRRQLGDVDRVLESLPGASLQRDDDGASGSLKLKLGTLQITYRVTIRATGPEGGDHAATVAVTGKEARGAGTLGATVDVSLHEAEGGTLLRAQLDLTATGRGETVSDAAWGAAADALLDGVVAGIQGAAAGTDSSPAPPAEAPAAVTTDAARAASNGVAATPAPAVQPLPLRDPSNSVRWSAGDSAATSSGPSLRRLAAAAGLLLLLLVVLRRRRRRR